MKRLLSLPVVLMMLLSTVSCLRNTVSSYEEDLQRLDYVLTHSDEYLRAKQQKISTMENMLHSRGVTPLQQYHIYESLYQEYQPYQFDKANDILDSQIAIAEMLDADSLRIDALLDKALILTTAGYYLEADRVFDELDTLALSGNRKVEWYIARQKYLSDYNEYVSASGFQVPDVEKIGYYQNRIIELLPDRSYYSCHIEILSLIFSGNLRSAYEENIRLIGTLDKNSRDYAVQTYWQGQICDMMGDVDNAVHWWVESAICDITGAIKDNASLSTLAAKLIDPRDTDRAFRYIRFSLDDATFYNAKLRKVQIATSFPMIEKAYTDSRMRQEHDRRLSLIFIIVIAFLLAFVCALTFHLYLKGRKASSKISRQNEKLIRYTHSIEEAEDSLRKTNLALIEANAAKEEYLGLFLSMCSGYLDKLKKTISRDQYESELKNFYKVFDTSFLSLYPTFVEEFNSLLKEDERLVLKDGEMLNTELRIFALIKLGITQSSHIASLLRYSVNTIYNYRAQVKNSVMGDRENFEELVRKLGSKR